MSKRRIWGALAAATMLVAACDKPVSMPPAPQADVARAPAADKPSSLPDTSVPPADAALAPAATAPKTVPPGTRANAALTPAQQSTTMPMAGQANDHSAPLPAAKGASAP